MLLRNPAALILPMKKSLLLLFLSAIQFLNAQSNDTLITKKGDVVYYDFNGKAASRLTFLNNQPQNGSATRFYFSNRHYIRTFYTNGKITKIQNAVNNYIQQEEIIQENEIRLVTRFYPNSKVRFSYRTHKGYLDGTLRHYDEKGTLLYEAILNKGHFSSGTLWILNMDYDAYAGIQADYIVLKHYPLKTIIEGHIVANTIVFPIKTITHNPLHTDLTDYFLSPENLYDNMIISHDLRDLRLRN